MMNFSERDVASAYYLVYNTIMNERRNGGYYNVIENKKYTERAIMSMIDKMNPLDISKETKGRITSKRTEFLNYLSPENKAMAKKLEKEYQYNVRKFKRIINKSKYRRLFANHI
jgi:hypothetical protein